MKDVIKKCFYLLMILLSFDRGYAEKINDDYVERRNSSLLGTNSVDNFSLYLPTYFVFGKKDLKMQFSFKYRVLKNVPLYLGFTQLMFWSIYQKSKPFSDINYSPEFFYRLVSGSGYTFKTLDLGYMHTSNGKDGSSSRSMDRLILRANFLTNLKRHHLDFSFMFYEIYNQESDENNFKNYLGLWDFKLMISKIVIHENQSLDLDIRFFSGEKLLSFKHGANQVGLVYNFSSPRFNPAIYLQRYEGYAENLLFFQQYHSEYRLGLLFSY